MESETAASAHFGMLRRDYRVAVMPDVNTAVQYLQKATPALVVADIDTLGSGVIDICRAARSLRPAATALVTTTEESLIPDVLSAGCDAVLLKPFAANLLYARIGRLLRTRTEQMRLRARQMEMASSFPPRPEPPLASTNRTWPETACPACNHGGAVSFEFSSYRRSWYACLACKKVWIAKRQE